MKERHSNLFSDIERKKGERKVAGITKRKANEKNVINGTGTVINDNETSVRYE